MRKAQRWNNETSKRSLFDSMLDRVVRDLFSGPDRPKYRTQWRRPAGDEAATPEFCAERSSRGC